MELPTQPDAKPELNKSTLLEYLMLNAHGFKRRQTADKLSHHFKTYIRRIQALIEELRIDGYPLISSRGQGGVFIPTTIEEAAETFREQLAAAVTHISNVNRLRRNLENEFCCSMKTFIQQHDPRQLEITFLEIMDVIARNAEDKQ